MFTGIVEEKGRIQHIHTGACSCILTIEGRIIFEDLKIGDSVAVNGVCLTVVSISGNLFTADVMRETLERSSLGSLKKGSRVNLERAMAANGRLGGHIVSGHIDGTGTIVQVTPDDNAVWYTIQADASLMRYIVEKGSIAIDGISLTVAGLGKDTFRVSVIPHTAKETILSEKKTGDVVNLENDVIAKYIEKLMRPAREETRQKGGQITMEWMAENGFL